MNMNKLIIGVYEDDNETQKIIKYGLDVSLSNKKSEQSNKTNQNNLPNIEIKSISNMYNWNNNFDAIDCIVIKISYDYYLNYLKNNSQDYNLFLSNYLNLSKFIIIVEHKDNIEDKILDDKLFNDRLLESNNYNFIISHIVYSRVLEYLSLIRNGVESVEQEIIDNILREELGNQKYKKLDSNGKMREITKLIKNEDIVNEWMEATGFDKLTDIIDENLIKEYNTIVCSHCMESKKNILNEINTLTLNNFTDFNTVDSVNNINSTTNNIQISQVSNLIGTLLETFNVFNFCSNTDYNSDTNTDTNSEPDNTNNTTDINELLTKTELDNIILNLNSFIINTSVNQESIKSLDYEMIKLYLDNLKNYIKTFNVNEPQINQLIFTLMKNKIELKFDEELFNELKKFNSLVSEPNNDEHLFSECVKIWIENEPNNFYDMIAYADKTNQHNLIELVVDKFIKYTELSEYVSKINLDKLLQTLKIILEQNKINSSADLVKYDTIVITQLMYIVSNIITHNNSNDINKYQLLNQMKYIFDNYVKDNIYYNDNETNLFIHNILWNYSIIITNQVTNQITTQLNLIEYKSFVKVHNDFKKLITILFDFVGVNLNNQIEQTEQIEPTKLTEQNKKAPTNNSKKNIKVYISEDEEQEDEEDEEDEDEEEDEEEEDEEDEDEIERIYEFIKKTTNSRKLNQLTLKKIAKNYLNKTNDYNKSIKLFESDMINKKFTQIYKDNNK